MSSFVSDGDLYLRCDCCNKTVLVYKDCTDHTVIHLYIHDHKWKTIKIGDLFHNLCPACIDFIENKKREHYFNTYAKFFLKGHKDV